MAKIKVEAISEGWLVKGTQSSLVAKEVLNGLVEDTARYQPGRYRKVPGQWSPWNLYKGEGPGSFDAVIVYV